MSSQKSENIEFEFFSESGKMVGREYRSDSIVASHRTIEDAARHLLSFYGVNGTIGIRVCYKGF